VQLFECLYRSWAHQPVALLGLCLLAQCYTHAAELSVLLSQVDITVGIPLWG
jgi:vacuole morphology and inheritance protein 14